MSPTENEQLLLEALARLGDVEARRKLGPSAPPPLSESALREWPRHLRAFGQDQLLRATAAVIRSLGEALAKVEEHINSELYVKALYGREKETRARITDVLRSALLNT